MAVTDPVYPVYIDTNLMAERTGSINYNEIYYGLLYLPCVEETNFVPELPKQPVNIIYIYFPNNPT